jgi:hypothetical protein
MPRPLGLQETGLSSPAPIAEIARLGHTPSALETAFLAYFDAGDASNGGTEPSTASSNST